MRSFDRSRGQVLPVWILGIIGTLALIITSLNYGNTLRWHIRAQSAADAAAQGVLALQSQRWNEMMELLYGMNVEEYRIRHLLNGILLASTGSGGCEQTTASGVSAPPLNDCMEVYNALTPQYIKAVQRYSSEATLLNRVSTNATYTKWLQDATTFINELQTNCNSAGGTYNGGGGDCAFTYGFVASKPIQRSASTTGNPLESVYGDGGSISIPSYGNASPYGTDTENQELFAPVQVDVITCTTVPPLIPNFFNIRTKPFVAVGRATATNVMFVQDWFQPGGLVNPSRSTPSFQVAFQPLENYGTPAAPAGSDYDYYSVDFGGNAAIDYEASGGFANTVAHDELSVRLGWWNSIPVHSVNPTSQAPSCPSGP